MTSDISRNHKLSDEHVFVIELMRNVWAARRSIIIAGAVSGLLSLIIALSLPNKYRSSIIVVPNLESVNNNNAGLSQGLKAITMLSGGGANVDPIQVALETIKSKKFVFDFIERHNILVPLMSAKGWDVESGKLLLDKDIYVSKKITKFNSDGHEPIDSKVYKKFISLLNIGEDPRSGLITISVDFYSPKIAQKWATWIIKDINTLIQTRNIEKFNVRRIYLMQQIQRTDLSNVHEIFYNLIQEQIKNSLLAETRPEYVFAVVDPAAVPDRHVRPIRLLWVVIGTFLGMLGALATVYARSFLRNYKNAVEKLN